MDWIKANYDKALLGVCGVVALACGGWKIMDSMSFPKLTGKGNDSVVEKSEFGDSKAADIVKDSYTRLKEVAKIKSPSFTPGLPARLFSPLPTVKPAEGESINLLAADSPLVRPPIDNKWLYENNLDITRSDIATLDNDADGFNNTEEWKAKTNPLDSTSYPDFTSKLTYKRCERSELQIKFSSLDKDEVTLSRKDSPGEQAKNWSTQFKVGDGVPLVRDGSPEYTLLKVGTSDGNGVIVLENLTTKKQTEILEGKTADMADLKAVVLNPLTKEELTITMGESVAFKGQETTPLSVIGVTDSEVILMKPSSKTPVKLALKP